jgi:hypothetical protein
MKKIFWELLLINSIARIAQQPELNSSDDSVILRHHWYIIGSISLVFRKKLEQFFCNASLFGNLTHSGCSSD